VVAAGPFTTGDSLAYDALRELMELVRRDRPHALILMGPFLDVSNQVVESGDISYKHPNTETVEYLDYEQLFKLLMQFIRDELDADKVTTKVVLIPSHKEVHHPYPLPCPAFREGILPKGFEPILLGNPTIFRINDISFGVLNADSIKDVCLNMITKNKDEVKGGKMTLALESMFQQRNFFPLLPGSDKTPIDYEQWEHL
jgi:DNA polymerase alpha subunit B